MQGTLEDALATVLRVPQVRVVCAGRTDTGVHARGRWSTSTSPEVGAYVAARAAVKLPLDPLVRRLERDPASRRAGTPGGRRPPEGFDARFSAIWRRYAYRVATTPRWSTRWPAGPRAGLAAARSTSTR